MSSALVNRVLTQCALMSRKTEADYVAVLTAIKEKLNNPVVDNFVLDFKQGK
ncbi:hypothetical protein DPMN_011818 [Dreissena polymorpha]|uniref:Uncharacterized protein n=1 Tax=Dreissena polymorpha TaxID=45954 RepID=A0A9D4N4E0_DREPO|nr:hypothetical protein DPMN_011818 [Dreissena polymorpha]